VLRADTVREVVGAHATVGWTDERCAELLRGAWLGCRAERPVYLGHVAGQQGCPSDQVESDRGRHAALSRWPAGEQAVSTKRITMRAPQGLSSFFVNENRVFQQNRPNAVIRRLYLRQRPLRQASVRAGARLEVSIRAKRP
jgi:hypothetical protein